MEVTEERLQGIVFNFSCSMSPIFIFIYRPSQCGQEVEEEKKQDKLIMSLSGLWLVYNNIITIACIFYSYSLLIHSAHISIELYIACLIVQQCLVLLLPVLLLLHPINNNHSYHVLLLVQLLPSCSLNVCLKLVSPSFFSSNRCRSLAHVNTFGLLCIFYIYTPLLPPDSPN